MNQFQSDKLSTGSNFEFPGIIAYFGVWRQLSTSFFLKYGPIAAILVLIFIVFLPIAGNYFVADDVDIIVFAKMNGLYWRSFFDPINEHLLPFFRAVIAVEVKCFGTNPKPYYFVNMGLHLLNTWLAMMVFMKLAPHRYFLYLGGLLFGLSAAHWQTVMWISCQAQLLCATFFLIGTFWFISYCETSRSRLLFLSWLSHLCMLLAYTNGIEIPFLYLLFFLCFAIKKASATAFRFKIGLFTVLPFFLNVCFYFILRYFYVSEWGGVSQRIGGWQDAMMNLPQSILFLFGGIYYGFLRSFTGSYSVPGENNTGEFIFIVLLMGILFLLLDKSRNGSNHHWKMAIWLFCAMVIMYALPVLPRIPWGFEWFITRSRYRYLPCIPAAGLAVLFFVNLRPFLPGSNPKVLRMLLASGFVFVILSNAIELRKRETFLRMESQNLHYMADNFIQDVRGLFFNNEKIIIQNEPFSNDVAGWCVYPEAISLLYLSQEERERMAFVDSCITNTENCYTLDKRTGHLIK